MNYKLSEIAEAVGGRLICGDPETVIENVSTNSRVMRRGDIFIPVIGEKVDAHRFLAGAFKSGAAAAFSMEHDDEESLKNDPRYDGYFGSGEHPVIRVDDSVPALQRLALYHRSGIIKDIPLIGVTGSVGKTTTREMIAAALSSCRKTFKTSGNQNSQIGLPVTLLQISNDYELGVIELGMSMPGEMTKISRLACLNAAVITNIGVSHLAQLGSQENILIEKLHILDGMKGESIKLFLNGNDNILKNVTEDVIHGYGIAVDKHIDISFFGTGENAEIRAECIRSEGGFMRFRVRFYDRKALEEYWKKRSEGPVADAAGIMRMAVEPGWLRECEIRLSVMGEHMMLNALSAMAAADFFGLDIYAAARALSYFGGCDSRGEILNAGGILLINDCYNAAPDSVKAGLKVLSGINVRGHRIAVLADMLELGDNEAAFHEEVGSFIAEAGNIDDVLLYGKLSENIRTGIEKAYACKNEGQAGASVNIRHFDALEELTAYFLQIVHSGDAVLVKGSNGMKLSALVNAFKEEYKTPLDVR